MVRFAVSVCVLALTLASCSDDETLAPVEEQQPRSTYGQIDDLVQAVDEAGLVCSKWEKPKRERLAADSRYCGDEESVAAASIYTSGQKKDKAIRESVEFAELWRAQDAPEMVASLLVGENWIVEGTLDEVKGMEGDLGGVVQDNSCQVSRDNHWCDD